MLSKVVFAFGEDVIRESRVLVAKTRFRKTGGRSNL